MSTLRVNKLENTNTSNGGISIDTSGHVSIDGTNFPTSGPLSNRNLIINGAMQVAQRGTSQAGISSGGYWTVDRWMYGTHGSPSFVSTMAQSTDGPVGFSNSLRIDITTAQASLGTSDAQWFDYRTEAQDCQVLNFGTSDAKSFTLSFWVKSNKTGTYVVWVMNHDGSTASNSAYTIDTADTWEYKTLTFAGDTSQAIANDNGIGLLIRFVQAAGTNYTSGTSTAGFSANNMTDANRYVGLDVNIADSTDNDWSITGVQLEVGETATPFEHRSYGDELARCERYYEVIRGQAEVAVGVSNTTTGAVSYMRYRTVKRAAPSTVTLAPAGQGAGQMSFLTAALGYPSTTGSHNATVLTAEGFRIVGSGYSGLTDDSCSMLFTNGEVAVARVDAEL